MAGFLQALCQNKLLLLLALWLVVVCSAKASQWQLQGLSVNASEQGVKLSVDQLSLADEAFVVTDIRYVCPNPIKVFPEQVCEQAQLTFEWQGQIYQAVISSQINHSTNQWSFNWVSNQGINLSWSSEDESVVIELDQMKLAELMKQWPGSIPDLPEVSVSGKLLYHLSEGKLYSQENLTFNGLSYEYSEDIIAAALKGTVGLTWFINTNQIEYAFEVTGGEALVDALYVDFAQYPITHSAKLTALNNQNFQVQASIQHQKSFQALAEFSIDTALKWQQPQIHIKLTDAELFNRKILSSILGIYGFGNTEMAGEVNIQVDSRSSHFDHWQITFKDFYLLNETRKVGADALNGVLNWSEEAPVDSSELRWEELLLAGLPVSESQAAFHFVGGNLSIIGAHQFPIFDGAIAMNRFQLENMFADELDLVLEAEILPISLKLITEKLNWPVMAGQISGKIPGMIKQGSVIQFLGALNMQVFGGRMQIDQLSMERLFGVAPVIAADIEFKGFDLSLLTETFGFGLITGRLSGEINDLRITNWKTDRMDAQIYTEKTQDVEQVISQRAIDNISSLGGIKGAISKSFLRFFDDFKYKKIKLSCKLHNSVCEIGGIKNQQQQFVIVEGGGIPKINIVGYVRSINWEEFIDRLLNANYESSDS